MIYDPEFEEKKISKKRKSLFSAKQNNYTFSALSLNYNAGFQVFIVDHFQLFKVMTGKHK